MVQAAAPAHSIHAHAHPLAPHPAPTKRGISSGGPRRLVPGSLVDLCKCWRSLVSLPPARSVVIHVVFDEMGAPLFFDAETETTGKANIR
jgi:hypothetical protein